MTNSSGPPERPAAPDSHQVSDVAWHRDLLERLAFASLVEQRRSRRWNIAFKFSFLAYLVVLLALYLPSDWLLSSSGGTHTALVNVEGVIAPQGSASADRIVGGLRAAFEDEDAVGVIVRINSPGGSPVQAGYINDEISRLRAEYPDKPLYAVIADVAASGGYYVAAAADKIYADKSSLVGSIGVVMNGFGFVGAMDKLGVERRLLTAGKFKGLLDPFSPEKPVEVAHIQGILDRVHRQFIAAVKRGRGDRLRQDDDIFSGLIWTGEQGMELGLVDALGSSSYVAREVIGAEEIVDYTPSRSILERVSERIGSAMAHTLATELGLGTFPWR